MRKLRAAQSYFESTMQNTRVVQSAIGLQEGRPQVKDPDVFELRAEDMCALVYQILGSPSDPHRYMLSLFAARQRKSRM